MEIVVAIVVITTVLYVLVRIIEMKYVQKEMKPMKEVVRDAATVSAAVAVSAFAVLSMNKSMSGFFGAMTEQSTLPAVADVFTDNPGF